MRSVIISAAAAAAVGFCAPAFGQGLLKNDQAFGLSLINAANNGGNSVDIVRGQPNGTNVGLSWTAAQAFIQSTQFDNLDGIRHNPKGNLVGLTFGPTATGGTLINLDTRFAANPGTATEFFTFANYNTANPGAPLTISRLGGLTLSPDNSRLAVIGSDTAGAYVFDYTAGDSAGNGAAVANGRELLGQFRSGATQGAAWLDNDNLLVADGNGNLQRVTVPTAGALSTQTVASFALPYTATVVNPFTSVVYEPTISPFVYVAVSQFSAAGGSPPNATFNKMYVFDPANSFASVGSIDFNTSSQTSRELAFDSNGDLYISQFGSGTVTASIDVFRGAFNPASLTTDGSVNYYTSAGTASFNGTDVALAHPDYKTAGVNVNLRDNATAVEYFGASPLAAIKSKLQTGYASGAWTGPGIRSSVAAANPGTGIGYKEVAASEVVNDTFAGGTITVGRSSIYLAYTLLGDANIDRTVNISDFALLAAAFNTSGSWSNGDFNYDGVVNIGDFSLLASNFNRSLGAPRAAVPEPAAIGGAVLALTLIGKRSRRQ